jgi:hypothetical protein
VGRPKARRPATAETVNGPRTAEHAGERLGGKAKSTTSKTQDRRRIAIRGKALGGAVDDPAIDATEITVFTKAGGPLTKRIKLAEDGSVVSDGSACVMSVGKAQRNHIANIGELATVIEQLRSNQAITLGALRAGQPKNVKVVTKNKLNGAKGVIARTGDFIHYRQGHPAFVLIDFDRKEMPPEVADRLGEFWKTLVKVLPGLRGAAHVVRRSTSAGLFHTDTGEKLPSSGGWHAYVLAKDGGDIERFLNAFHDRCWLAGLGWIMVGKAGQLLERSIIDRSVSAPERLVFEGPPILKRPLAQDAESRRPIAFDGEVLDTLAACPSLSPSEQQAFDKLVADAKEQIMSEAVKVRAAYVEERAQELVKRTGMSKEAAVHAIECQCRGVLLPDFELAFADKELKGATVGDVLADPKRFGGRSLADPIEGVWYGHTTAMVMLRRSDGHPWIKSFAHGGVSYSLEREAPPNIMADFHRRFDAEASGDGVSLKDFHAYMPMHNYIFAPSREVWPATSVNARVPPVLIVDARDKPVLDAEGEKQWIKASTWLDQNQAVEQMTWAPGLPMIIADRLISNGGWIERRGVSCFNLYRPPTIELGNAGEAGPWLDHVRKIYPDDADHIIKWCASRVQKPEVKINHALVLGSNDQGIGKDTLLEPVKRAIGHWNFDEVSPQMVMGEFNGFLKNVILRINEARDLGDVNRYQFYDHMKAYTAAPPDVLRVNEKHLREYSVLNCVGVIITTNHKTDGIFLPAEDRRHYVAWSECTKEDFDAEYWKKLWSWYDNGGDRHVAAYLMSLDISDFNPKAAPPKTVTFWDIVDANRAPEDAELADVLDKMANPDATTLKDIESNSFGSDGLHDWLTDRKNRRAIPHRLEKCGYVPVHNPTADDGLWKIKVEQLMSSYPKGTPKPSPVVGKRQVVYAKKTLPLGERITAAQALIRKHEKAAEEYAKKATCGPQKGKGVQF